MKVKTGLIALSALAIALPIHAQTETGFCKVTLEEKYMTNIPNTNLNEFGSWRVVDKVSGPTEMSAVECREFAQKKANDFLLTIKPKDRVSGTRSKYVFEPVVYGTK